MIIKYENDYATTTSGGVATIFVKHIILNGGVVYGAVFDFIIYKLISKGNFDNTKIWGTLLVFFTFVCALSVIACDFLFKGSLENREYLWTSAICFWRKHLQSLKCVVYFNCSYNIPRTN